MGHCPEVFPQAFAKEKYTEGIAAAIGLVLAVVLDYVA